MQVPADQPPKKPDLESWYKHIHPALQVFWNDFKYQKPNHYGNKPFDHGISILVEKGFAGCQSPQVVDTPGGEKMRNQPRGRSTDEEAHKTTCKAVIEIAKQGFGRVLFHGVRMFSKNWINNDSQGGYIKRKDTSLIIKHAVLWSPFYPQFIQNLRQFIPDYYGNP